MAKGDGIGAFGWELVAARRDVGVAAGDLPGNPKPDPRPGVAGDGEVVKAWSADVMSAVPGGHPKPDPEPGGAAKALRTSLREGVLWGLDSQANNVYRPACDGERPDRLITVTLADGSTIQQGLTQSGDIL